MEAELPNIGLIDIYDKETGDVVMVNTNSASLRDRYASSFKEMEAERNFLMQSLKIDSIKLQTHLPYLLPLIRFFKKRSNRR